MGSYNCYIHVVQLHWWYNPHRPLQQVVYCSCGTTLVSVVTFPLCTSRTRSSLCAKSCVSQAKWNVGWHGPKRAERSQRYEPYVETYFRWACHFAIFFPYLAWRIWWLHPWQCLLSSDSYQLMWVVQNAWDCAIVIYPCWSMSITDNKNPQHQHHQVPCRKVWRVPPCGSKAPKQIGVPRPVVDDESALTT